MTTPQPSRKIGAARGTVTIDTSRLKANRTVAVREARLMGDGIKRGFEASTKAASQFEARLDSMVGRIRAVRGELLALSAGGAALSGFGLKAADNFSLLLIRFRELTGSEREALALMTQLEVAARRFNLPVRETQTAFAGLVPAIRDVGGELEDYVGLIARLSLLNASEGIEGAIFAVREALSSGGTDLVSLAERFNLSRVQLRELIAETGDFAVALDIALNKQGATNRAVQASGQGLQATINRLGDTVNRVLERAFIPSLQGIIDLVEGINDTLEQTPDGLIQFAGSATIATTAVAGVTVALTQLLSVGEKLAALGVFSGAAKLGRSAINFAGTPTGARVGIAAAAVPIGAELGVGLTREIGRNTGNERLTNYSMDDALKTAREGLFLIVDFFIQAVGNLIKGIGLAVLAFFNIPNYLRDVVGRLEIAIGDFIGAVGAGIIALSEMLGPLSGDLAQVGAGVANEGARLRSQGTARIEEAAAETEAMFNQYEEEYDARLLELRRNIGLIAGVVSDETENAATETLIRIEQFTGNLFTNLKNAGADFLEAIANQQLASFNERLRLQQSLLQYEREGTTETIAARLTALGDEQAAIESMLPELEALARVSTDGAEKLAQYRTRLEDISRETEALQGLLPDTARRELASLSDKLKSDLEVIEGGRASDLKELNQRVEKSLAELKEDTIAEYAKLKDQSNKELSDWTKRQNNILSDYFDKMQEIELRRREGIVDAAARLDAAGVAAARRRAESEEAEANKRLSKEQDEQRERLGEIRTKLGEERAEILAYYQERQIDLIEQSNAERALINERYDEQIAEQQAAYNTELSQLRSKLQAQLTMQQQFAVLENALRESAFGQALESARNFASSFAGVFSGFGGSSGRQSLTRTAANTSGGRVPSYQRNGTSDIDNRSRGFTQFATGGIARVLGAAQQGLALVDDKERILTAQQTASFDRLVDVLDRGGGLDGGGLPSTFTIRFEGDVPQDTDVLRDSFQVFLGEYLMALKTNAARAV